MSKFVVNERVRLAETYGFMVSDTHKHVIPKGAAGCVGPRDMPGVHVIMDNGAEYCLPENCHICDSPVEELVALAQKLSLALCEVPIVLPEMDDPIITNFTAKSDWLTDLPNVEAKAPPERTEHDEMLDFFKGKV